MSGKIEYKYNENELIKQFKEYVDNTYEQHYSQNKYQATEFIIAVSYTHLTLPTKLEV